MKRLLISSDLLAKSQVAAYTRKDGAMVQAHDSGRNAVKKPRAAKSTADKAAPVAETAFGIHHSELKEGDHLFDKHGQKVDEVEGFSRGVNSAVVHTRAGYSHSTHKGFLAGLSNKKPG